MGLRASECSPVGRSEDAADLAFGHWLAGFIDGEGCFIITIRGTEIRPRFQLCLRDDDVEVLEEIVRRTGIGRLYPIVANGTSKPQAMWMVSNKQETAALVAFLDTFPLRAKKARDYGIWRLAIDAWHWQPSPARRARLLDLRDALMDGRAYEAPEPAPTPDPAQLELLPDAA